MRIFISNHCEYVAVINIDSGKYIDIQPYQTISVECEEGLKTGISVRSNMLSAKKKRYYALELETCYIIVNAKRDEVFYITSEKNFVEYNAYYERLILNSDSSVCTPQSYKVFGEKIIKKTLKKQE